MCQALCACYLHPHHALQGSTSILTAGGQPRPAELGSRLQLPGGKHASDSNGRSLTPVLFTMPDSPSTKDPGVWRNRRLLLCTKPHEQLSTNAKRPDARFSHLMLEQIKHESRGWVGGVSNEQENTTYQAHCHSSNVHSKSN